MVIRVFFLLCSTTLSVVAAYQGSWILFGVLLCLSFLFLVVGRRKKLKVLEIFKIQNEWRIKDEFKPPFSMVTRNVVVVGRKGCGKTTLINVLKDATHKPEEIDEKAKFPLQRLVIPVEDHLERVHQVNVNVIEANLLDENYVTDDESVRLFLKLCCENDIDMLHCLLIVAKNVVDEEGENVDTSLKKEAFAYDELFRTVTSRALCITHSDFGKIRMKKGRKETVNQIALKDVITDISASPDEFCDLKEGLNMMNRLLEEQNESKEDEHDVLTTTRLLFCGCVPHPENYYDKQKLNNDYKRVGSMRKLLEKLILASDKKKAVAWLPALAPYRKKMGGLLDVSMDFMERIKYETDFDSMKMMREADEHYDEVEWMEKNDWLWGIEQQGIHLLRERKRTFYEGIGKMIDNDAVLKKVLAPFKKEDFEEGED